MSLARYLPHTRESAEEVKKRAWREYGMLVVNVDHPNLKWDDREMLKQVGAKLYGPRRPADSQKSPSVRNSSGSIS